MLAVKNLSKAIDGQDVLKGVDFTLEKGQVVGVVGRNGAGKGKARRW
jgi:acetoin utilization transport system ATP-binding protein